MSDFYEIDFLDVETKKSGDAIILRYELAGEIFIHVVDGGYQSTGEKLSELLKTHYGKPSFIDHVVVTHNDGDHTGGIRTILEEYDVGILWMLRPWLYAEEIIHRFSRYTNALSLERTLKEAYSNLLALEEIATRKNITIMEPFQGAQIGAFTVMAPTRDRFLDLVVFSDKTPQKIAVDQTTSILGALLEKARQAVRYIRASWGEEMFPDEDTSAENEMSVVQYANLCQHKILLTADTGREGLLEVINYAPLVGLNLPGINRFQVPHHGGRRNVTSELLDALVGPRLQNRHEKGHFSAIISSAKEDEDHPRKVVVRALIHRGADVSTTEGRNVRTSKNAPDRPGYVTLTPEPYPEEYEE